MFPLRIYAMNDLTDTHFICISRARTTTYAALTETMAHEMIHLLQAVKRLETRAQHNADFKRRAARVCSVLGFDESVFCG